MTAARSTKVRWYMHGDRTEAGAYFCAICDAPRPLEHFLRAHPKARHSLIKYRQTGRRILLERPDSTFYRPNDAECLTFAD